MVSEIFKNRLKGHEQTTDGQIRVIIKDPLRPKCNARKVAQGGGWCRTVHSTTTRQCEKRYSTNGKAYHGRLPALTLPKTKIP